jgi:hypothetical protein
MQHTKNFPRSVCSDTCYVYDPRASAAFHHVREATVDITAPYIADPCGALSLGNGTSLAGHWLLIDRSDNCTYDAQVLRR